MKTKRPLTLNLPLKIKGKETLRVVNSAGEEVLRLAGNNRRSTASVKDRAYLKEIVRRINTRGIVIKALSDISMIAMGDTEIARHISKVIGPALRKARHG